MKNLLKKLTLLALTLSLLAAPAQVHAMDVIDKTAVCTLKKVEEVYNMPFSSKVKVASSVTFCCAYSAGAALGVYKLIYEFPRVWHDLFVLTPDPRSLPMFGGFACGFTGFLYWYWQHESWDKNEFLHYCKNNNMHALKNFLSYQHRINLLKVETDHGDLISHNNYEGLIHTLKNNNAKMFYDLVIKRGYADHLIHGKSVLASYHTQGDDVSYDPKLYDRLEFYTTGASAPYENDSLETLIKKLIFACCANTPYQAKIALSCITQQNTSFNINDITHEDESLLHVAARYDNPEIIKFLLENGHKLNPLNKDGLTPLQLAEQLGSYDAAQALQTCKNYTHALLALDKHLTDTHNVTEKNLVKHVMSYLAHDDFKPCPKTPEEKPVWEYINGI